MNDPLEYLPGYVSPLTDMEHATLGRIAILWGQIEHFVEELLPMVTGLSYEEMEALQINSKTISSKVDFLKTAVGRIKDEAIRTQIVEFCAIIHETKTQRNHIFHGIWGWRADERTKRVFPAAWKRSDPGAPFDYQKLPVLEKKLCKAARMGFNLFTRWHGERVPLHPSRFVHHNAQNDPPIWLLQWSKRNPWDDDSQDRIERAGQLPRRSSLFPQR